MAIIDSEENQIKSYQGVMANQNNRYTLFAFTLAEVLITLTIIGVVAAIVIPAIVNNTNNQELKSQLKKTYTSLSQAYTMILTDNGGSFVGACSTDICIKDLFEGKLKVAKDCPAASSLGACMAAHSSFLSTAQAGVEQASNYESFLLSDGTSIAIWGGTSVNSSCTDTRAVWNSVNAGCGLIQVDLNGLKSPNKQGEDIYLFHLLGDRILPVGGPYSTSVYQYCDKSRPAATDGNGCAYVVLNGGWHN